MDKILQQIEDNFAQQIQDAQDVVNSAQQTLNDLIATSEEKKKSVTAYYEAIVKKEEAEIVIANTDESIKTFKVKK